MMLVFMGGPSDGDEIEGGEFPDSVITVPVMSCGPDHPPHVYILTRNLDTNVTMYVHQKIGTNAP